MADCEAYLELISASLDGAVTPAETKALKAHLEVCPQCRTLLEDLTALHAAMPEEEEPPQGFSERVMAAVAAQEKVVAFPAKTSRRRWGSIAAVAAVFALAAVGYGPLRHYLDMGNRDSVGAVQAPMAVSMYPAEALPTAAATLPPVPKIAEPALPTTVPEITAVEGTMDQVADAAAGRAVTDRSAAQTTADGEAGDATNTADAAAGNYEYRSYGGITGPVENDAPAQDAPAQGRMAAFPPAGAAAYSAESGAPAPEPGDAAPAANGGETVEGTVEPADETTPMPMPMMFSSTARTYTAALTLDLLPQGWEEALAETLAAMGEETQPAFPPEGLEVSAPEAQALITLAEDQEVPYTLTGALIEEETCLVTVAPPDAEITDPTPVSSAE